MYFHFCCTKHHHTFVQKIKIKSYYTTLSNEQKIVFIVYNKKYYSVQKRV